MACIHGHSGVVKILMKYAAVLNIDLHTKNRFYGWTAFHLACLGGHLDVIKILMENAATLSIDPGNSKKSKQSNSCDQM
jgi:ankyrin repeat protein